VHSNAIEGGIGMDQLVRAMPGFHVERTLDMPTTGLKCAYLIPTCISFSGT